MPAKAGGAEGGRTPDLLIANEALSQLSYGPAEVQQSRKALQALASAGHLWGHPAECQGKLPIAVRGGDRRSFWPHRARTCRPGAGTVHVRRLWTVAEPSNDRAF